MISGVVVDLLQLKSPVADAPKVYRDALLVCKLGTEIIALALIFSFDHTTIVADSTIELDEFCLKDETIIRSVVLFFNYFRSTLDSHEIYRIYSDTIYSDTEKYARGVVALIVGQQRKKPTTISK